MRYPNFREEKKLYKKGYKLIVGVDEVGRGALCGPVVACAITVPEFSISNFQFSKIKDSKKLSAKKREEIYEILKQDSGVEWGIGRVSERVIDRINILKATKLAMQRAVRNLEKNLERNLKKKLEKGCVQNSCDRMNSAQGCFLGCLGYLIIDGNFEIDCSQRLGCSQGSGCLQGSGYSYSQKSIIKADEKVFSCAAASIVAKVYRDRMMLRYHKKYPNYGLDRHKGYGTKLHRNLINKKGLCKIHRKTFRIS